MSMLVNTLANTLANTLTNEGRVARSGVLVEYLDATGYIPDRFRSVGGSVSWKSVGTTRPGGRGDGEIFPKALRVRRWRRLLAGVSQQVKAIA